MNSDNPPPYVPHPPAGPSAPGCPTAFSSPPAAFPGAPYQTFPQTYAGGGDHGYYHGPSGPPGMLGAFPTQPGYQDYHSGPPGPPRPPRPPGPWDGPKMYKEQPRPVVFMVDHVRDHDDGEDAVQACLSACSTFLCCFCLWDMLTHK